MTDDTNLPPLPRLQVPFIEADVSLTDIKVLTQWCERTAIAYARAAVLADRERRAQQPAGSECHCGTCTCDPNMTPAVRFDLSPAQQEGVVRDHLIRLGWTPPNEG